ncbi:MAG: hypothetical protein HY608_02435 [Planctomycetes bacterium]|nr:hypothetical protein [Planctomycetota bacterium]
MRARTATAVLLGFAVATLSLLPTPPGPLADGDAADVARQVERLRSADWSERQAGEDALRAMGEASIEGLLPFAEDPDPEVASRVGALLRENGGWRRIPSLVAAELDRLGAELAAALVEVDWQREYFLQALRGAVHTGAAPDRRRFVMTIGGMVPETGQPRPAAEIYAEIRQIASGAGSDVTTALATRARSASGPVAWAFAAALGETDAPETVEALSRLLELWDDEGDTYAYVGLGLCRQDAAFDLLLSHHEATPLDAPLPADRTTRRAYIAKRLRHSPAATADAHFGLRLDDPDLAIRLGAAARLERRGVDLHGYNPLLPVVPQAERIARIREEGGTPPADPWARPAAYIRTSPIQTILRTLDDPALWGENDIVRRQFVAMIQAGLGMGLPLLAGQVGGEDPTWVLTDLPKTLGSLGPVEAAYAIEGNGATPAGMQNIHVLVHVGTADTGVIEKLMAAPLLGPEAASRRRHGEKDYLAIPLPEGDGAMLYAAATPSGLAVALQETDMHAWLDAAPANIAGFLEARSPGRVRAMDPGPVGISLWCDVRRTGGSFPFRDLLVFDDSRSAYRSDAGGFAMDAIAGFRRIDTFRARAGLLDGFLGAEVEIDVDPGHPLYGRWRTPPHALDLRHGIGKDAVFALAGTVPNAGAFWKEFTEECERVAQALRGVGETDLANGFLEVAREGDAESVKEIGMTLSEFLAPFEGEACLLLQSTEPLAFAFSATHAQPERVLGNLRRVAAKNLPNPSIPEREHRGYTILPAEGAGFASGATASAVAGIFDLFGGADPADMMAPIVAWIDATAGAVERASVFEPGDGFIPSEGINLAFALNLAKCAEEADELPPEAIERSGLKEHPYLRAWAVFEERRIAARARLDVPVTRLLPGLGGFVAEQFGEAFGMR